MNKHPQFSRQTIIDAASLLVDCHADFDHLMLRLNVPKCSGSMTQKVTQLAEYALAHPNQETDDDELLTDAIVREAAARIGERIKRWLSYQEMSGATDEAGHCSCLNPRERELI